MEVRDKNGRYLKKYKDIAERKYFRLTAIKKVDRKNDHHAYWLCRCDCGNEIVVRKDSLESGHAKSCGCYLQERYKDGHIRTHGESKTRLYHLWICIKDRCYNHNYRDYHNYGGRGITMCDEWKADYCAFRDWMVAQGYDEKKSGHYQSIDRIDVNKGYSPENCRLTIPVIQNYNKRCTVRVDVYGVEMTLLDISKEYDLPLTTIRHRYSRFRKGEITLEMLISRGRL